MATEKSSTLTDWGFFFASLFVTILLLIFLTEWFWLGLPFVLTFFVRGMRWM